MIKVVLDTNVFVSSFFGGKPRKIVDRWKAGEVVMCLSKPIVDEYVDVLRRLGLREERELKELLQLFSRSAHVLFTARTRKLRIMENDPDDDKFIDCAVALKARFVITGDKDLAAIGEYMGIRIVMPHTFLSECMEF